MTLHPSKSDSGQSLAFDLLHRDVQEQLYRMQWTELRPVQAKAIHCILNGQSNAIITAPTAGGKTEAAFLPILSRIRADHKAGLRAIYVGPLKALINDQFRRLDLLCEELEVPVHRWHGDVSATQKKKLLEHPSGILLITPESTESILLNHTTKLPTLFAGLDFIVIDELHSFFTNERGAQLRSQLNRIAQYCKARPRIIALSATIGDMTLAAKWLMPGHESEIVIIEDSGGEREVKIGVRAYATTAKDVATDSEEEDNLDDRLVSDLFRHFSGKKALVFGNQKARIEEYADAVKSEASRRGVADSFLVHHGSLGRIERETTEDELKSDRKVTVICSSTLELGIDIGPVELVGQLDCPPSVNTFLQRLGRSGRRAGQAATMRLYYEATSRQDDPLPDRLHLDLIKMCAMCELVAEGWCESPRPQDLHLSTLVHQVLATIAEKGGAKAKPLFESLIESGVFQGISQPQFASLLKELAKRELIEQDASGLLILGRKGEVLARRYDFYAVFQTPTEYSVRHEHHTIGSVDYVLGSNSTEYLILAGKRWKVVNVDSESRVIQVVPSRGKKKPTFISGSNFEIDDVIVAKIREVLGSAVDPVYCDSHALNCIHAARKEWLAAGLVDKSLIQEGDKTFWFTWKGSRANRTLCLLLKTQGTRAVECDTGVIAIDDCSEEMLINIVKPFATKLLEIDSLTKMQDPVSAEKYDEYLPEDLWQYQFGINSLDISSAKHSIQTLLAQRV